MRTPQASTVPHCLTCLERSSPLLAFLCPGGVTFVSFLIFGSVPLWGYVIISAAGSDISTDLMFVIACILAGLTMFALGAFKVRAACGRV